MFVLKRSAFALLLCGAATGGAWACSSSDSASPAPNDVKVTGVRLYSNPGDFDLASFDLSTGDTLSAFGVKDGHGMAQHLAGAALTNARHEASREVTVSFDAAGRLEDASIADGSQFHFHYIGTETVVSGTDAMGTPVQFSFTAVTEGGPSTRAVAQAVVIGGVETTPSGIEGTISVTCGGAPYLKSAPFVLFTPSTGPGGNLVPEATLVVPDGASGTFKYYRPANPSSNADKTDGFYAVKALTALHVNAFEGPCEAADKSGALSQPVIAQAAAAAAVVNPAAGAAVEVILNSLKLLCKVNDETGKIDSALTNLTSIIDSFESSGTIEARVKGVSKTAFASPGQAPNISIALDASECKNDGADGGRDASDDGGACDGRWVALVTGCEVGCDGTDCPLTGFDISGGVAQPKAGQNNSRVESFDPVTCTVVISELDSSTKRVADQVVAQVKDRTCQVPIPGVMPCSCRVIPSPY